MTNLRHEWKHEITVSDAAAVKSRLRAIAMPDSHAPEGSYEIRSLYFDTPGDRALREKINGVTPREKFRIRYYNGDTSLIRLEKKLKSGSLTGKVSVPLTVEEARAVTEGGLGPVQIMHNGEMAQEDAGKPLLAELYMKILLEGLAPKVIVDYTREPFVYAAGNVRVTLDYNIRTGLGCVDFLNPDCVTIPAGDAPVILEVKWDAFLPDVIRDAVQLERCRSGAFSKYAASRIYG